MLPAINEEDWDEDDSYDQWSDKEKSNKESVWKNKQKKTSDLKLFLFVCLFLYQHNLVQSLPMSGVISPVNSSDQSLQFPEYMGPAGLALIFTVKWLPAGTFMHVRVSLSFIIWRHKWKIHINVKGLNKSTFYSSSH